MRRTDAERLIAAHLKDIYGFALKRCASLQDAEDLSQEIACRVFGMLLTKEDLRSPEPYIWTAAHHALANYYRSRARASVGIPLDELTDLLPSPRDTAEEVAEQETLDRLHREIARLSRLQRRIVIAYYFENKKQDAIAQELEIPAGTVKWHLFEAKKELKRGMDMTRQSGELKFNPIQFALCGTNGSPGRLGANRNFFHSALSQNIVYDVRTQAKTRNEIADDLGVSPVYVESEADYLAEYGFLLKEGDRYLCNILLDEAAEELVALHDRMYRETAQLFAGELFDALASSGILRDERILCCPPGEEAPSTAGRKADDNFLLWTLIPYIAAQSGADRMDHSISFEQAATLRPDGGHNICYASVLSPHVPQPLYFDSMLHWCGPCWNQNEEYTLWQIDSEWSAARVDDGYLEKATRCLHLLSQTKQRFPTSEEYAFLAQMGIAAPGWKGEGQGLPLQIVHLKDREIRRELLSIGDRIKGAHWEQLTTIKEPFIKAVLRETPRHLQTMQKFGLQYLFFSDGWFVLHCLKELVQTGRLLPPPELQKPSLTMALMPN